MNLDETGFMKSQPSILVQNDRDAMWDNHGADKEKGRDRVERWEEGI